MRVAVLIGEVIAFRLYIASKGKNFTLLVLYGEEGKRFNYRQE